MNIKSILIDDLRVNRANDRHGELENESSAIAWLFSNREVHMKNLAKDMVTEGGVYEAPLVSPDGKYFVVFDGNRRVTCLKLLKDPHRAPSSKLQEFFIGLRNNWNGDFPQSILCQVEPDRDRVDNILYRRHTGTRGGVGQSTWDDRMTSNFVARTGKGESLNVAEQIETQLDQAGLLPSRRKIPRSTMNRLLSAEPFRNRLGFSVRKKKFEFTHDPKVVLAALARVANDLASKNLVLGDIWDVDGKRSYLDQLEAEGVLPTASSALKRPLAKTEAATNIKPARPSAAPSPSNRNTLIPPKDYQLAWPGRLQRHHQIWEELQFRLKLSDHPNAISVLFRVLLELAVENYLNQNSIVYHQNDKLSNRLLKVGNDLATKQLIDKKHLGVIKKFQNNDQLISADTMNRYIHSASFAPSPQHLTSMWDSLAEIIVLCLKA